MPKAWCDDADDTDVDEVDKDEHGWVENLKYVDTSNTWSLNEYSKLASPLSWISGRLTGWPLIARHFMIFWFACYIILGISNFTSIFAQTCPPFPALRQLWRAPRSTRNTCKQTSHDMLSLSVNTMDEVYTYRWPGFFRSLGVCRQNGVKCRLIYVGSGTARVRTVGLDSRSSEEAGHFSGIDTWELI